MLCYVIISYYIIDKMQDYRLFRYVIVLKPNKKRHAWNSDLSTKQKKTTV